MITTPTADDYIKHLHLQPHPEGGFYKETYRSAENIAHHALPKRFPGQRSICTAIYYLLRAGDHSSFHRIKSDECWHFYAGGALLIHIIDTGGNYYCIRLGPGVSDAETFQFVVPEGAWFAAEPAERSLFSLAGCTVAPGFDFADFEIAKKTTLLKEFPQHDAVISRLCK